MPLDFSSPRPVYLQIADDVRAQIEQGRYVPGDKLPSRKEMARQYEVAPETVKKALDELARAGLVGAQSTRGTFVLKMPEEPGPSPEFLELMQHVKALEERLDALEAQLAELRVGQSSSRPHALEHRDEPRGG